jgi:hypothetical protein
MSTRPMQATIVTKTGLADNGPFLVSAESDNTAK